MPPKKDKGKDAKADKNAEEEEPDEEEKELLEKELVISYLKSKLGRYQEQGEKLSLDNVRLGEELEQQKVNLRDINEFLTNELKARSLTSAALEKSLADLKENLEQQKTDYEERIAKIKLENEKEVEELEQVIKEYKQKMKISQEYLDQKDALEAELAKLKDDLATSTASYEQQLADAERNLVQEKDKWKKEMAQRIKDTKTHMMRLTDNQLEMTTKRTIMENEQMASELAYQSRQTEKLLYKNQILIDENNDLRRQLDLSRGTEEELAKRNHIYQKTLKGMLAKMATSDTQKQGDENLLENLDARIRDLEDQVKYASLQLGEKQYALESMSNELSTAKGELKALRLQSDETARFLLTCMKDVKKKIVTVVRGEEESSGAPGEISVLPGNLSELSLEQRERALAYLLDRLQLYHNTQGIDFMNAVDSGMAQGGPQGTPGQARIPERMGSGVMSTPGSRLLPSLTRDSSRGLFAGGSGGPLGLGFGSLTRRDGLGDGGADRQKTAGLVDSSVQTVPLGTPHPGELVNAVLSDVRPWGTRAAALPLKVGTGTFLRRGNGNAGGVRGSVPSEKWGSNTVQF